jgi:peptidoglycan/xylan/chitin deacetylase (PgdA/CDA1 family)
MIDASSHVRWPAGHRAALSVVVHVPGVGLEADTARQPGLVGVDYTATGLQRILETLADVDVSATVAFTAEATSGSPQLLPRAVELGHEVAASACSATASIPELIETISSITGSTVNGLIEQLPGLPSGDQDERFGDETGNAWRITGAGGDLPNSGGDPTSTIIPVSPYLIDMTWLSPSRPLPPSSMLEAWSLALAAHRAESSFMPVLLHPHIVGRPSLASTITRFLDEVVAAGDVWIARLDHVARAWHELAPQTQE